MRKKPHGKTRRNKSSAAKHGTEHAARRYVRVVYIKVTEKSLTTSGPTGEAVWIMCRFAWFLGTRIVLGSPHDTK